MENKSKVRPLGKCAICGKEHERFEDAKNCCATPTKDSAVVSPKDAAELVEQWRGTLTDESKVSNDDGEDLMFRIIAFANRGASTDTEAKAREAAEELRDWLRTGDGEVDGNAIKEVAAIIEKHMRRSAGFEDGVRAAIEAARVEEEKRFGKGAHGISSTIESLLSPATTKTTDET